MKKAKIILSVIIGIILLISIGSCAKVKDIIGKLRGDLIGQHFLIKVYDDYGNKTLSIDGSKVTVGLLEDSDNFDTESSEFKSEVLEITTNGNAMFQVGNTVIFEEDGLDIVEDYEVEEEIVNKSGGGYVPFDRFVNKLSNEIGKEKIVIISSQQGIPIGVYEGKDVYVTIPENLPKMTRLNIDGKALYIHRANYVILDSDMIK